MSYVPDRPPAPYHPPYPPAPTNVLGIVGFVLSLVAVITAGALSPIALLISGIGLLKPPRAFAVAGVIISCLGTVALIAWVSLVVAFVGVTQKVVQRNVTVMNARNEIYGYANRHGGRLPSQAEGDRLVSRFEDAWGKRCVTMPAVRRCRAILSDFGSAAPVATVGLARQTIRHFLRVIDIFYSGT